MENKIEFNPHSVQWTEQKIVNFWDSRPSPEHFGEMIGRDTLKLVKKYTNLKGTILDYGCGKGSFLGYLSELNLDFFGADTSGESLKIVEKTFENDVHFKGVLHIKTLPLAIAKESVDFIFFNGVIEHILPPMLEETLREFYRVLKPGGYLVVTTANRENLDKYRTICPDCGCIFHYMQHVGSFSVKSMPEMIDRHGFKTINCQEASLEPKNFFRKIKVILEKFQKERAKLPHLISISQK